MVPSSEAELMYSTVCSLLSDPSLHDTMALWQRCGAAGAGAGTMDRARARRERGSRVERDASGEGVTVGAFDC